jgi:hypothetical protein
LINASSKKRLRRQSRIGRLVLFIPLKKADGDIEEAETGVFLKCPP